MLVFGCSVNLSLASTTFYLVSYIASYNNLAQGICEVIVLFILFSHLPLYSLLVLLPVGEAYPAAPPLPAPVTGGHPSSPSWRPLLPLSPFSPRLALPPRGARSDARGCSRPRGRVPRWPDELCVVGRSWIDQLLSPWPGHLLLECHLHLSTAAAGGRRINVRRHRFFPSAVESRSLWWMEIWFLPSAVESRRVGSTTSLSLCAAARVSIVVWDASAHVSIGRARLHRQVPPHTSPPPGAVSCFLPCAPLLARGWGGEQNEKLARWSASTACTSGNEHIERFQLCSSDLSFCTTEACLTPYSNYETWISCTPYSVWIGAYAVCQSLH
jgi:hypothetical protein